MSERRKVEERIRRKEQEIQQLEEQLREARVYIQALQDVLKIFPRDSAPSGVMSELRVGSGVAQARETILKRGVPMHISELLQAIGKEPTKEARLSLGGSLAAYVRKGAIFTRPAPNTFGLIELGHQADAKEAEPPAQFGEDDDTPI